MRHSNKQGDTRRGASGPKVTAPSPIGVYPRRRLFRLLDVARKHPVVWIAAPAGSGKTTLAVSYARARHIPFLWYQVDASDTDAASFFYYMGLAASAAPRHRSPLPLFTPEYRIGFQAFTANYFRSLFEHLKRPGLIVLDNYHELGADQQLHEVLQQGFEQIPHGVNVLVLSRDEPPGSMARLRASGRIAWLGWEELRLTEEESAAIVKTRRTRAPLPRATIGALHRQAQGWIAGLVLLMENPHEAQKLAASPSFADQSAFDYFANAPFSRNASTTQEFLLKTALSPKISADLVEALTGNSKSGSLLRDASRRNPLITRYAEDEYQYQPLFRAFLLRRAEETYGADFIKILKRQSAQLLAEKGNFEAAVYLLREAEDWQAAARLMVQHASTLLHQGRVQTLQRWLDSLPDETRTTDPWVLYWLGACRIASSPKEARTLLEQAFALFEKEADASPLYLAWSGIVDSLIVEWNDFTPLRKWLDVYPTLDKNRAPPAREIETASIMTYVTGLRLARTDDPNFIPYTERAERVYQTEPSINQRFKRATTLMLCYVWLGHIGKMERLLEQLAPLVQESVAPPLARIYWYLCKCMYATATGAPDEALQAVAAGLTLAKLSGIHVLDDQLLAYGIQGQLGAGNVAAARKLLEQTSYLAGRGGAAEGFHSLNTSMVYLHEGNAARAADEATRSLRLAGTNSFFIAEIAALLSLAYASTRLGDFDTAMGAVARARTVANNMKSKLLASFCAFCEANMERKKGEQQSALASLRESLTLAAEMGTVTPPACRRDDASALYAMALENDIQARYVRDVITKTDLAPPNDLYSEAWPWQVRIHTFGRFIVVKNGETAIAHKNKALKKIFDLLGAIIAYGGNTVSVQKVLQTTWPRNHGKSAERALDATLDQLRELLGNHIIIRTDTLSLNPKYCWLDVWAFERLLHDSTAAPPAKARHLLGLYRGAFLAREDTPAFTVERNRLRAEFARALLEIGASMESEADDRRAVALYEQAIDVEPSIEDLYVRLMQCYRRLDRASEAIETYARCQRALTAHLRTTPRKETQLLHAEIKKLLNRSA